MVVAEVILGLISGIVLLLVVIFFTQVTAALIVRGKSRSITKERPSVAILIPAHNESNEIKDTIGSVTDQLTNKDRLVVVADNCSDDTVQIATDAGVEVIVREDSNLLGKGYALDFGIRYLKFDPPEVVIILDADCQVELGAIDKLVRICSEADKPVQSLYLMHSPQGTTLNLQISEFAWLINNWVRPLGYRNLGLPCRLMGTGMAFPWTTLSTVTLATDHLVEDLKLGIDLTTAGKAPIFYPEATVKSSFPFSNKGIIDQRTRWEHGHLGLIVREVPKLLLNGFIRGNVNIIGLALDLALPPLALFVLILLALTIINTTVLLLGVSVWPSLLVLASLVLFTVAVFLAWWGWGRRVISMRDLLKAPYYIIGKIPIYCKFCSKPQKDWVRTDREK